jgi:hypothetical protein
VLLAYENIGGHEAFSKCAGENKTEFYRIAARLIPTEIKGTSSNEVTVIVNRSAAIPETETTATEFPSGDAYSVLAANRPGGFLGEIPNGQFVRQYRPPDFVQQEQARTAS